MMIKAESKNENIKSSNIKNFKRFAHQKYLHTIKCQKKVMRKNMQFMGQIDLVSLYKDFFQFNRKNMSTLFVKR